MKRFDRQIGLTVVNRLLLSSTPRCRPPTPPTTNNKHFFFLNRGVTFSDWFWLGFVRIAVSSGHVQSPILPECKYWMIWLELKDDFWDARNRLILFQSYLTDLNCWVESGRVTLECCVDGRQLGLNCYNGLLLLPPLVLLLPLLPQWNPSLISSVCRFNSPNKCPNRINSTAANPPVFETIDSNSFC